MADATNLRLHLRLVIELKKLGRPLILALNMMDVAEKRGCRTDAAALSAALGVAVVPTVAIRRSGVAGRLAQIDHSFAGMLGHALAPLLAPIGFTWQIAIALVPGMAAREVAVAALGTVYALSESGDALESSLAGVLAADWSLPTALALLAWFVFTPQCVSTLSVVRRETNSWFWTAVMIAYMTLLAYAAAFATFHVATALLGG